MSVLPALGAGIAAGLGVAIPLGAVGVLLLNEGMTRGRRSALEAAAGVAVVDLVYAAAAVLAGGAVASALSDHERVVRLTGAAVLAALAGWGLLGVLRKAPADPAPAASRRPGSVFWRFVGLTSLNPSTALYFTVLTASLGERVRGAGSATAFVLGVFAGSLAWQGVLAIGGAAAGTRLPPTARRWTSGVGHGIVLLLAAALALSA